MNLYRRIASLVTFAAINFVPAVAQNHEAILSPTRRSIQTSWKVDSAKVGIQEDGATWTTTLWLIAPRSNAAVTSARAEERARIGKRFQRATLTFVDKSLKPIAVLAKLPGGAGQIAEKLTVSLPAAADRGIELSGVNPAFAATIFTINVSSPAGYLVYALPVHRNRAGVATLANDVTASTAGTLQDTDFGAAFDIGADREVQLTLYNPQTVDSPVTVCAYGPGEAEPFATTVLTLPAQRSDGYIRGGMSTWLLSQVFESSAGFTARRVASGGSIQGVLIFKADLPFNLMTARIEANPSAGATGILGIQAVRTSNANRVGR